MDTFNKNSLTFYTVYLIINPAFETLASVAWCSRLLALQNSTNNVLFIVLIISYNLGLMLHLIISANCFDKFCTLWTDVVTVAGLEEFMELKRYKYVLMN
jgi:hypothetical protein